MSETTLSVENLRFNRGNEALTPEEVVEHVRPFFNDLQRVGRTNHLCVFVYGDETKPDVTGYRSDTTINATINTRALKAQTTGGKWAIYDLVS
jgi:hypothetical protein